LNTTTLSVDPYNFTAEIFRADGAPFLLKAYQITSGGFRVRIEPIRPESFVRFDAARDPNIINLSAIDARNRFTHEQKANESILKADNGESLRITYDPVTFELLKDGEVLLRANADRRLLFESNENITVKSEVFQGLVDKLRNGASAVALDFHFNGANIQLSGLSPRSLRFNLLDTYRQRLIRLFTIGAFGEYGVVPFIIGHAPSYSAAFFWINPSDSFVEISRTSESRKVWMLSEAGYIDFVLFSGQPNSLLEQYTTLTGKPMFAPLFALGYHQCKWGYVSQELVEEIIGKLQEHSIPFDTIWLDIDHLKGRAPFIFDRKTYPDPPRLFKLLKDRFLVRITDPHVPISSTAMYTEGDKNKLFVRKNGRTYVAECWPGRSSWPNFLDAKARTWWGSHFTLTKGMPANVHIWNDMNEPAVFGPTANDGTFPKDLIHTTTDGVEHEDREVHSLYGLLNAAGTYLGLLNRTGGVYRPFILTRSFFSGTQKFAWTWSGDNTAQWVDLRVSIASLVVSGLGGVPFTGTDVGGFFGNSTEELLVRWYQAGAWCYPFFREHCDINAAFREPYLLSGESLTIIRSVIRDRYRLLPLWYTAVRKANLTGEPVVKPLWFEFPSVAELHTLETEVLVANSILVVPIATPSPARVTVIKPPGRWYRFFNGTELTKDVNLSVPLSDIPVYIRGGKIVPIYSRYALSTKEILTTPITLHIALDENGHAEGDLYLDDGETHAFLTGQYLQKRFEFSNGALRSFTEGGTIPDKLAGIRLERLVIYDAVRTQRSVNQSLADDFVIEREREL
jgi:alpha 1,3-glucosidase